MTVYVLQEGKAGEISVNVPPHFLPEKPCVQVKYILQLCARLRKVFLDMVCYFSSLLTLSICFSAGVAVRSCSSWKKNSVH